MATDDLELPDPTPDADDTEDAREPMDDLEVLDAVNDVLRATCEVEPEPGYRITGAMVIGLYVAPDNSCVATFDRVYGSINAFTEEGILRWLVRRCEGNA